MQFLKKYRIETSSFILLIISYFFLRLIQILNVPIFTDEAIYTRWAQIAKQDSAQRFISLTDGKQPLFIWLAAFFMKFFHDPLLAARMVSVFAGFATMIGLFFLAKELFKNRWVGFFSMFLYIISPFSLVYDRLVLYDGLVGTFYIWSLYFGILLTKKLRLDFAFILGFVLGAGALNKSIGLYSMYLLPTNLLLFPFKQKKKWRLLSKWIILIGVSSVVAESMYAILRLSPWFYIIKQKDATFFYPLSDLLHKPISFWIGNFFGNSPVLSSWFVQYITWPVLLLIFFAVTFYKEFWKEKLLLFLYFILPLIGFAFIAKIMYPRYLFFMTLPLFPIAAYSVFKIKEKIKSIYAFILICFVVINFMLYADFYILTDFAQAPIPQSDRNQYSNDWPAGGGVKEIINYLEIQSQSRKVYVGTEGTFGLMPYSLEIYLNTNKNITIKGFWPITEQLPKEVLDASKKEPTYFIFYQPCPPCRTIGEAPQTWPVKLIRRYYKGNNQTYISLYQLM